MGRSPLDKFAALRPAMVPLNSGEPIAREISWINAADVQDLVAGPLEGFWSSLEQPLSSFFRGRGARSSADT